MPAQVFPGHQLYRRVRHPAKYPSCPRYPLSNNSIHARLSVRMKNFSYRTGQKKRIKGTPMRITMSESGAPSRA